MHECECFRAGDDVRFVTSGLVGRINSSDETGTYHEIWLYGITRSDGEPKKMKRVPSWQIEFAAKEDAPSSNESDPAEEDNVINFTKAVDLMKAKHKDAA